MILKLIKLKKKVELFCKIYLQYHFALIKL